MAVVGSSKFMDVAAPADAEVSAVLVDVAACHGHVLRAPSHDFYAADVWDAVALPAATADAAGVLPDAVAKEALADAVAAGQTN